MQRGFSLVELSIVLVILGLLTGGILAGQSLIRAAELRSVTTEHARYQTAIKAFREKYFALPGDMTNATSFWGVLNADPATCRTTASTNALTCNGDGDGLITTSTGSFEQLRIWQHMANAGLIEGTYTGALSTPNVNRGVNVPASKLANAYWMSTSTATPFNATFALLGYPAGTHLMLSSMGGNTAISGSYALRPEEAWNIDTKLDDGKAATGVFIPYIKGNATNTNCTTFAGVAPPGDAGLDYALSNPNKDCSAMFMNF